MGMYGYIRTSRDLEPDRPGMNPKTQRRDLLEADVPERDIHGDIDVSGVAGVATRNAWRSVDARPEHGDVLVVVLDRIERRSLDVMGKIHDLMNRGVRLHSRAVNGARFEAVAGEPVLVTWSLFVVAETREELLGMPPETNLSLLSPDLRNPVRSLLQSCCDNDESERSCNKFEAMIMHGEGRFQSWPVEVRETILVKCASSRDTDYKGIPCLIWMGSLGPHGRPQMGKKRTEFGTPLVYRVTYQLEYGQLDDGITIDHLCGETRCIEPLHLRPQTVAENSAGGTARHRPREKRQAPLVHFQPYDHIERTVCSQNAAGVTSDPSQVTCSNCLPAARQFREARKQGLID